MEQKILDIEAKDDGTETYFMPKFKIAKTFPDPFFCISDEERLDEYVDNLIGKTKKKWLVVKRWTTRTYVDGSNEDYHRFIAQLPISSAQDFGRIWQRAKIRCAETGETKNIYQEQYGQSRWRKA